MHPFHDFDSDARCCSHPPYQLGLSRLIRATLSCFKSLRERSIMECRSHLNCPCLVRIFVFGADRATLLYYCGACFPTCVNLIAAWGLGWRKYGFGYWSVCICRLGHGKAWQGGTATWYEEDCEVGMRYVIA